MEKTEQRKNAIQIIGLVQSTKGTTEDLIKTVEEIVENIAKLK